MPPVKCNRCNELSPNFLRTFSRGSARPGRFRDFAACTAISRAPGPEGSGILLNFTKSPCRFLLPQARGWHGHSVIRGILPRVGGSAVAMTSRACIIATALPLTLGGFLVWQRDRLSLELALERNPQGLAVNGSDTCACVPYPATTAVPVSPSFVRSRSTKMTPTL